MKQQLVLDMGTGYGAGGRESEIRGQGTDDRDRRAEGRKMDDWGIPPYPFQPWAILGKSDCHKQQKSSFKREPRPEERICESVLISAVKQDVQIDQFVM